MINPEYHSTSRVKLDFLSVQMKKTKRRSPQVQQHSRQISREHSIRQFELIGILPLDFVNQSQSLAFSETRITNH
jgi:hypothetical protein